MKARLGREESHLDIDDTTRPDLGSIDTGAIVEAGDITDEGSVQSVVVNAPENAELMLSGDFEAVGVDAPNVTVQLTRGMVKDLIINENWRSSLVKNQRLTHLYSMQRH